MSAGLVSAAVSATHASKREWRTYVGAETAAAKVGMESGWFMRNVRTRESARRRTSASAGRRFYPAAAPALHQRIADNMRSGGLTDSRGLPPGTRDETDTARGRPA